MLLFHLQFSILINITQLHSFGKLVIPYYNDSYTNFYFANAINNLDFISCHAVAGE